MPLDLNISDLQAFCSLNFRWHLSTFIRVKMDVFTGWNTCAELKLEQEYKRAERLFFH